MAKKQFRDNDTSGESQSCGVSNNDTACRKMKNLALKTTTSCGLRVKIGEKSNQFLPCFFALFYRCKCSFNDDHGVKNGFGQNLKKKD